MKIRRIVTGHTAEGKAIFVSDEEVQAVTSPAVPGGAWLAVGGGDQTPRLPLLETPACAGWFPPAGGFRFAVVSLPPDGVEPVQDVDVPKALAVLASKLPGMLDVGETTDPGMHTTDSVDFIYLVSGRIELELDDGATRALRAGDCVVQNGTRHAWRNPYGEPCVIVAVNIGGRRTP